MDPLRTSFFVRPRVDSSGNQVLHYANTDVGLLCFFFGVLFSAIFLWALTKEAPDDGVGWWLVGSGLFFLLLLALLGLAVIFTGVCVVFAPDQVYWRRRDNFRWCETMFARANLRLCLVPTVKRYKYGDWHGYAVELQSSNNEAVMLARSRNLDELRDYMRELQVLLRVNAQDTVVGCACVLSAAFFSWRSLIWAVACALVLILAREGFRRNWFRVWNPSVDAPVIERFHATHDPYFD